MVVPYSPWSNGGVERVNRVFLKCIKALLKKRDLNSWDWPGLTPAVQESLNKVLQVSSRGGMTRCRWSC